MSCNELTPGLRGNARFASTRWSVVLAAAERETIDADAALASLCESYWYPVYAYARRRGHSADEAQDLAQGFFTRLIEKRDFATARPERGRFRSYLLSAFLHYVSNERDRTAAIKRGGGQTPLSLDFQDAEQRYLHEPGDCRTPETLYARRWVMTLLESVLGQLETEFQRQDKTELFGYLKPMLTEQGGNVSYRELASRVGISETALKVAVHRLRRRYRDLLREAVAGTLDNPNDVDDEIGFLFRALESR